jgi:hypothetical protein
MSPAHAQSNTGALLSTLTFLLEKISEEGCWKDFRESWEPILTCVAADVLIDVGLKPDQQWFIRRERYVRIELARTLQWLNGRIQPRGGFGTDFWDACRLAVIIEKHKLHSYFTNYSDLQNHLISTIESNAFLSGDSEWVGPGFLAIAADYLALIGRYVEASALVARLQPMQEANGRWCGALSADGSPLVPPVWHTAQVVLTLSRRSRTEHRDAITRALSWILNTQDRTGKWPGTQQYVIYATCYAILALLVAEVPDRNAINLGLDFLKKAMHPDGRMPDLGGTLMAAIALHAVSGPAFEPSLTTIDYVLARVAMSRVEAAETATSGIKQENERLQEQVARLKEEIAAFEHKYGEAEVVFTKRQLFGLSIISLLVTVLGTVAGVYALQSFLPAEPKAQVVIDAAKNDQHHNLEPISEDSAK